MKYTQTTPCNACPFLIEFKRSYSMSRLVEFALSEFPCHKTCSLKEDDDDGMEEFIANEKSVACAGAMIFLAKRKEQYSFGFDVTKLNMKADIR